MSSKYDVLLNRLREKDANGGGGGIPGILEWQSTSELSNDTYVELDVVAGKVNVYIFEDVNHLFGPLSIQCSIDNGVSWKTGTTDYAWYGQHIKQVVAVPVETFEGSLTWVLMDGPATSDNTAISHNYIFETNKPVAGTRFMIGSNFENATYSSSTHDLWTGRQAGMTHFTNLVTNIRFSSQAGAGKMVSGKIHHYIRNVG